MASKKYSLNLFEENTFKQYYYQTLSDEDSSNIDNLSIVKDSPKQKRKRDEEESLDKFFEFSKNKKKKQCSSVSRAQPNGGVAYLSTNREDACSSTHLIKIEVYELKTLAKIPSSEHWKNATIRIKYYTDDKNKHFESIKKTAYNITKEISMIDSYNVSVVDSAFGQRIISYKVKNKNQSDSVFQTPELFLELIKSDIFFLIDEPNPHHLLIMSRSLNTHKDLLSALHKLKPKYRTALLKSCDEDEINCICECIHNVLQGKVPIEEKNKKKLKNYKSVLRKLVRKGVNKARKSIIIQKGGAFLPIILGAILSGLVESLVK
ncbi:hypothetical protein K1T71_005373 [Dendrolimus kikuchii]|uniref:Uncharacterized protein n=1 Tax=Dendrolimus kikuchii TaxID=765133 RepID=A0ACC1D3V2_9NEOP|nr:hypothetical protein K1T71_005373 [Dendrolimus kikuchii]